MSPGRFIIRNWITRLKRLTCPGICPRTQLHIKLAIHRASMYLSSPEQRLLIDIVHQPGTIKVEPRAGGKPREPSEWLV